VFRRQVRLLRLFLLTRPSIQTALSAEYAFPRRFVNTARQLRALNSFMAQINTGNSVEVLTSEGTTSTSYTSLATPGPTANAVAGISGAIEVTVSANISIGTGATGAVGLYVDGSPYFDGVVSLGNNSGGSISVSTAGTITVPNLTAAASHTFELFYKTDDASVEATFSNRVVNVQPV
jgi:hypothetical protein